MPLFTRNGFLLRRPPGLATSSACCCGVSSCNDCVSVFPLQAGQSLRREIFLSFDLSFSTTCSGTAYSASFSGAATAINYVNCPFNCSNCIFGYDSYATLYGAPSSNPLCGIAVDLEFRVDAGQCRAIARLQARFKTFGAGWADCSGQGYTCGQYVYGQVINNIMAEATCSSAACMNGRVLNFNSSIASTYGNTVVTTGSLTLGANPLP